MSALDHVNPHQFMAVHELLQAQSNDALQDKQRRLAAAPPKRPSYAEYKANPSIMDEPDSGPGPDTTVQAVYDKKARDVTEHPMYHRLDEPLRNGTIDPIVLDGNGAVYEGHHRIIRAHQLGVERLPVARVGSTPGDHSVWDTQTHQEAWDRDLDKELGKSWS